MRNNRAIRLRDLEEAFIILRALTTTKSNFGPSNIILLDQYKHYIVGEFIYQDDEWTFDSLKYGDSYVQPD